MNSNPSQEECVPPMWITYSPELLQPLSRISEQYLTFRDRMDLRLWMFSQWFSNIEKTKYFYTQVDQHYDTGIQTNIKYFKGYSFE